MLAVELALMSAVSFGASDYAAGLATRTSGVLQVTFLAQVTSLTVGLLIAPWVSPFRLPAAAAGWSALAGAAGVIGAVMLYLGFRHAAFSVASTLSAVGAAVLPVLAGLFYGERPAPLAWAGIAFGIPAIAAISAGPGDGGDDGQAPHGRTATGRRAAGVGYGLAAGVGFALFFIGFDRAGSGSGLWPVIVAEAVSLPVLACCALPARQLGLPAPGSRSLAAATGATAAVGSITFFLASHHGLLAVTAVITSLYPGGTILLARISPGERLNRVRLAGLALAGASVALIAVAGAG
jgi:drug/metabolite transporter (DMT)-like permease